MSLTKPVLVLDNTYLPLNIVNAKKAITYVIKNKAIVIEEGNSYINSGSTKWCTPSIIKLSNFTGHSYYSRINIKLNKKTLLERDENTCQYCSKILNNSEATVDHVVPKGGGFGGKTVWTNCVISCQTCNSKKGNKTPKQAGMKLLKEPKYPHYMTYISRVLKKHLSDQVSWKQYFIN